MEKGFYHPIRGYWQTLNDPSEEIRSKYPAGTIEVSLKPGIGYEFDGEKWIGPSQEWLWNYSAAQIRQERDIRLQSEVDPITSNLLRWNDLTAEARQSLELYRRELLDITSQSGFPFTVIWPTKST